MSDKNKSLKKEKKPKNKRVKDKKKPRSSLEALIAQNTEDTYPDVFADTSEGKERFWLDDDSAN